MMDSHYLQVVQVCASLCWLLLISSALAVSIRCVCVCWRRWFPCSFELSIAGCLQGQLCVLVSPMRWCFLPSREKNLRICSSLPSVQTEWVISLCTLQTPLVSLIQCSMYPVDSCIGIVERWKGQIHTSLCQFKLRLPNSLLPFAPVHPYPMLMPELSSPKTKLAKKKKSDQLFLKEQLHELS